MEKKKALSPNAARAIAVAVPRLKGKLRAAVNSQSLISNQKRVHTNLQCSSKSAATTHARESREEAEPRHTHGAVSPRHRQMHWIVTRGQTQAAKENRQPRALVHNNPAGNPRHVHSQITKRPDEVDFLCGQLERFSELGGVRRVDILPPNQPGSSTA